MPEYYYPCLPYSKFSVQDGTGFLDPGYEEATGALHTGVDVNIKTGGDTDLGYPVNAITDGTVVYVGVDSYIGGIVIIYHPGPKVWSVNWHLKELKTVRGAKVVGGKSVIGTIGKGGHSQFSAHLHFEIRLAPPTEIAPDAWPTIMFKHLNSTGKRVYDRAKALAFIEENYVDGIAFLRKNNAKTVAPKKPSRADH